MLRRPRRNRKSPAVRNHLRETHLELSQLVHPLFVVNGQNRAEEVPSLPGNYRFSIDKLLEEVEESMGLGIHSFILFPVLDEELKDGKATYSYSNDNFYLKAISELKRNFSEACIITDVALDPYSSDGHDGLVENDKVLNDETLSILAKMALAQAQAGADVIGPSDMMDGRVQFIREQLDWQGFKEVSIMSYTAKYASSFYGPFRDALGSAPQGGDKQSYQMDPANKREAILEGRLDFDEGADYLMVKPAASYLDVIHTLKNQFEIPIAAYNVSGECAMIKAAGQNGWLDYEAARDEMLLSIKRAGADVIISYFAKEYAAKISS